MQPSRLWANIKQHFKLKFYLYKYKIEKPHSQGEADSATISARRLCRNGTEVAVVSSDLGLLQADAADYLLGVSVWAEAASASANGPSPVDRLKTVPSW